MLKFVGAMAACAMMVSSVAMADDTQDYCNKVRARAAADSSLLYAPIIQVQAIKFPSVNPIEPTAARTSNMATDNGYQVRGLISWSPLDFYKGFQVQGLADADCKQHEAMINAMNLIGQAADLGKLPAYQKEVAYLNSKKMEWQNIVSVTEVRLKNNIIVLSDAMAVRQEALALDRKLAQMQGNVGQLSAKDQPEVSKNLNDLAHQVETASVVYENQVKHNRSLDSWTVGISGGIVPPQDSFGTEWFGVISVGFNFGAFTHNAYDSKYVTARTHELQTARYEVRDQLNKFKEQVAAAIAATQAEIEVIESEQNRLTTLRTVLQDSSATATPALIDSIDLERIDLDSDLTFLVEFKNQLQEWQ